MAVPPLADGLGSTKLGDGTTGVPLAEGCGLQAESTRPNASRPANQGRRERGITGSGGSAAAAL
ncbi:MAG TPA: hypothetical protein VH987_06710 [Candidatus Limnocylindria bacterium]